MNISYRLPTVVWIWLKCFADWQWVYLSIFTWFIQWFHGSKFHIIKIFNDMPSIQPGLYHVKGLLCSFGTMGICVVCHILWHTKINASCICDPLQQNQLSAQENNVWDLSILKMVNFVSLKRISTSHIYTVSPMKIKCFSWTFLYLLFICDLFIGLYLKKCSGDLWCVLWHRVTYGF